MLPNNIFNRNNERREHVESHTGFTISTQIEHSGRNTDLHYASVAPITDVTMVHFYFQSLWICFECPADSEVRSCISTA